MSINFNETFLDENSTVYNYYIGIPNMEINNISDIDDVIKRYRKRGLDYLSINLFNFNLHSNIPKENNTEAMEMINKFILSLMKKYKITFIFSYSISANPIAYLDCWNSKFIYKGDVKSINNFTQYLINDNSAFLTVKKPHRGILSLVKTPVMKIKLCSVEVCNFSRDEAITDFENIYYTLLDRGWVLGAISSYNISISDIWYTGIISRHCYSDMLIDSIKNKLTYATNIPDLKLYFSVNFIPMGKTLELDNEKDMVSFYVFAYTDNKIIGSIEIISNNKRIIKKSSMIYLNRIHYIYKSRISEDNTWFSVRLLGENGVIAISSPVFIKHKKSID